MFKTFHVPERTCIFCRNKLPKKHLIRFCFKNNCIILDELQKEPGRGAYVCLNCLSYIEKPKFFKKLCKVLKLDISVAPSILAISFIFSSSLSNFLILV